MFNKVFYATIDKVLIEEFILEVGMPLPVTGEYVCLNEKHYQVTHRDFDYSKKLIVIIIELT